MGIFSKKMKIVFALLAVFALPFLVIRYEIITSRGSHTALQVVEIQKGENIIDVGTKLEDMGVVSWRGWIITFVWTNGLRGDIVAGKYQLSGSLSVAEIALKITSGEVLPKGATVTFPEGWDSSKMAARLTANALPGEEFMQAVRSPDAAWRKEFWFLRDMPEGASVEGFLFPDTYTFSFDSSGKAIVYALLKNFAKKVPESIETSLASQQKTFFQVISLASIVENEVSNASDRKMVADIFWRRLAIGQPLQSDATVKYVNGESKIQHSFEETRIESPYNTYIHTGLPPGPIGNPGIESILATVTPTSNLYFYFLNDAKTGETVFSVTFEEHIANKAKHGL